MDQGTTNKAMNEDIPIEMKNTNKKKATKGKRNPSKLGMNHDSIYESNLDYRSSQKKNSDLPSSPKKKYEALKTKYVKLNEHLKQADVIESTIKKKSKSPIKPPQIFQTPTAFNHSVLQDKEAGAKGSQKSNMVINLEINKMGGASETVKDIKSPVKATSPLLIKEQEIKGT